MAMEFEFRFAADAGGIAGQLGVGAEALADAMEAAGATAQGVSARVAREVRGYLSDQFANGDYDLSESLADALEAEGVDLSRVGIE